MYCIHCLYAELTGPRLCRAFVQTASINCWDGQRQRVSDITRFDVDGIAGQGILSIKYKQSSAHTHTYTHTHTHKLGLHACVYPIGIDQHCVCTLLACMPLTFSLFLNAKLSLVLTSSPFWLITALHGVTSDI